MLAALVRIPFVLLPPLFSDDVYRHRWDGRVVALGRDPYRFPPSSPALASFRDAESRKINHPRFTTVYGPLAQGLLGLLALSPARASVTSIKAMAAAFDLVAVAALFALGGSWPAVAYALHPLAIVETAGDGHLDGVSTALLLVSLALLSRAKGRLAAVAFAAATLVKLTPLGAAPALLRGVGRRGTAIAVALFAAAHLPFLASGGPFKGLSTYARSWEANGVLYPDLVRLLTALDAAAWAKRAYGSLKALLGHPRFFDHAWPYFYDGFLARALLAALFVAAAIVIHRRERDVTRASGLLLVSLLVVSPTLHPWYLVNVLPFALLFRWTSVAWVAGAAPLAHVAALPPGTTRAIELLPALALAVLVDRRRRFDREEPA